MILSEGLCRHSCFADATEESLKAIGAVSSERDLGTGDVLFREGDAADHLYIVTRGEVDIEYVLGDGEPVVVDTIGPGELLGWSAIVPPYRMTATAVAGQDTRLVVIRAAELRRLCAKDAVLGHGLMARVAHVVSQRLDAACVQLATEEVVPAAVGSDTLAARVH